jgi:WhiB family redox-sensing transcriptional regulator
VFFTDLDTPTEPARRICADCPVKAECREYALAQGEQFGIWGGLTAGERQRRRRAA